MIKIDTTLTDDEIKRIYEEEYVGQHIGGTTLQRRYGRSFYDAFKRLGLAVRNNQEKNRKFSCDSNYFDVIDTEEKAYWLGMIFADGYITSNKGTNVKRFGISLQESDTGHLEKLQAAINTNTPIHHYSVSKGYKVGTGYCRLIISDDVFAQNLIKHGCCEHKSNIIEPPIGVPKELERHFIRGFMDGNGSVTMNNSKYGLSFTIKWASTEKMLKWIMNHLIENGILTHEYPLYKRKEEHIVTSFEFGGNYLVKKYLDYIYNDASIWLDRKHDRYNILCDLIKEKEDQKFNKCDICGIENSYRFIIWKGEGEHHNKILCGKHYNQLYRYGKIFPDKKDCCDICGDTDDKLILVGNKYPNYQGMTLCRRHYNQLYTNNKILDSKMGIHKK